MDRSKIVLIILVGGAFLILGVVVGTLLALSEQSLAQAAIAALFATFGGSIVVFLEKLNTQNQLHAVLGLLALSTGTLVGTYSGIYVNEHLLLTPSPRREVQLADTQRRDKYYLRADILPLAAAIDTQYRNGQLKPTEAYEKLRQALESN